MEEEKESEKVAEASEELGSGVKNFCAFEKATMMLKVKKAHFEN